MVSSVTPQPEPVTAAAAAFEQEATPILQELRDALAGLLSPDSEWSTLAQELSITQSVAWQVFQVATCDRVLAVVPQIPKPDAMSRVLAAASKHGHPGATIDRIAGGYRAFEDLVHRYADDRAAFDAMATGIDAGSTERTDIPVRRAAFRANSQLWGFRAALVYQCVVIPPDASGLNGPHVIVRGVRSLQSLRPVRVIPLGSRVVASIAHGEDVAHYSIDSPDLTVLEEFCSRNMPTIVTKWNGESVYDYVKPTGLGIEGQIDYFTASNVVGSHPDTSRETGHGTLIHTPCEECILDMALPAGVFDPASLDAKVYACPENVLQTMTMHPDLRLPGLNTGQHLGTSIDATSLKSFPECPRLIRQVLRHNRWESAEYELYRYRVRYPIMHTFVSCSIIEKTPGN